MISLNQNELEQIVDCLREDLVGAQLQEVKSYEQGLALSFYQRKNFWLVIDMQKSAPFIGVFEEQNPWLIKNKTKPVSLFINSHAKNLSVLKIEVLEQFGRVVLMELGSKIKKCELEFHLIPQRANLLVRSEGKKISWNPVFELTSQSPQNFEEVRSLPQLRREWLEQFAFSRSSTKSTTKNKENPFQQLEKSVQKKLKALTEIEKKRQEHLEQSQLFFALGEELKGMTKEQMRHHLHSNLLDLKKNVSWNMELCFEQAKAMQRKAAGALERKKIVQQEIQDLEEQKINLKDRIDMGSGPIDEQARQESTQSLKNFSNGAQLRKLELSDGIVAYKGKSARDNLDLLRSARSWDLWMHLKDYPGAYLILRRQKKQVVVDKDLHLAARWLAKDFLSKKENMRGLRLSVVMTESRFVRPIKGDKIGRVNYHSARELVVLMD